MNSTFLLWVVIIFAIFCKTHCQVLEGDVFSLICPNGMKEKGFSWYAKSLARFALQSTKFSICVQCKPEEGSNYDQIEMCLANTEHILGGIFSFDSVSCDTELIRHPICNLSKPNCGLKVNINSSNLNGAISKSIPIDCANQALSHITKNNEGYDIELVCPENSKFFGLERFTLPPGNGF